MSVSTSLELKSRVREFWNAQSCGEAYATGPSERDRFETQSRLRYQLEPYLLPFAGFADAAGKDALEIGVGMGADHVELAKSPPKSLSGIDLTARAVDHTRQRLRLYGLSSDLRVSDTERLPFADESFDFVYSWGVLHHSPNTSQAVREVFRVLRPGGVARVMIYHKYALTGYMLWLRYGLLHGRPWRGLDDIYCHHLESPGTKAYTVREAREMFGQFADVSCRVQLCFGDLLEGNVGQRHRGPLLSIVKKIWPRPLLRVLFRNHGLDLLIEAKKR
jgi:SAM-dependent methyltransferase